MVDPFSLEIFVRQRQDRNVQQAARERLIRGIRERPLREDARRIEGIEETFRGVLYRLLARGVKLMVTQMSLGSSARWGQPMRILWNARAIYILSSAIVWAAIIGASGVLLRGSPHFAQMLAILGGGAVWFVILVPTAPFGARQSS